jgi:hypothetical protein
MKPYFLASALLACLLTACGGGGDNPAPSATPSPGSTASPTAAPAVGSYEALSSTNTHAAALAQLTAQGSRGYNYFGPNFLGDSFFNFYAKDSNTSFSYEILDNATSATDFTAQLNAQGAKGFDFWGPTEVGAIYSKESNATTVTHQVLAAPTTVADFLAQANAQGDNGFVYAGPYSFGNIYTKTANSNAKYTYRILPEAASHDALVTQANAQGAEGYKFGGLSVFSGEPIDGTRNIYVKDSAQSSTFSWKHNPAVTSAAALVSQANTEAAAAYVYWFSVMIGATQREMYFKPSACTGVLCRSTSPL